MRTITLEELLEAGSHFGHQVTRQNPKARDYVFEARDNIHIIDLAKTKTGLDDAASFVKALAGREGTTMVILGAKRQAQGIVRDELERATSENVPGLYSVTNRWIGGILTNFQEVSKNFKRLNDLTKNLKSKETQAKYTKKEIAMWDKERQKLMMYYGGIADMTKIPDAVFVIDTHLERLAVAEAIATRTKTIGITDTNADPTIIDYPIPANDDAVGSIKIIVHHIVDAWIEGKKKVEDKKVEEVTVTESKTEASEEKPKVVKKKTAAKKVETPSA